MCVGYVIRLFLLLGFFATAPAYTSAQPANRPFEDLGYINRADSVLLVRINLAQPSLATALLEGADAASYPIFYGIPAASLGASLAGLDGASWESTAQIAATFLIAAGGALTLKKVFGRPRPYTRYSTIVPRTDIAIVGLGREDHDAFPSGHATMAFALATTLARQADAPALGALAYGWAGTTAVARLRMGVHYPSDIVAGAVLGTVIGFVVTEIVDI